MTPLLLMVMDLVAVVVCVCRSSVYRSRLCECIYTAFMMYLYCLPRHLKASGRDSSGNLLRWVKMVPTARAAAIFMVNGHFSDWSIYNYCRLLLGLHPSAMQLSLCGWTPCYPDGEKHALKSATAIIGHAEKFTLLPAPLHYLWSPMLEIPFDKNNQWAPGIFQPRKDAAFFWEEETSMSSILIWMVAPVQVSWNRGGKRDFLPFPPHTWNTGLLCVSQLNKTLCLGLVSSSLSSNIVQNIKNTSMCIKIRPDSYTWCLPEPKGMLWRISSRILNKKRERQCVSVFFSKPQHLRRAFLLEVYLYCQFSALVALVYGKMEEENKKPQNWNLLNSWDPSQRIILKSFCFDEIWKALFSWKQFAALDIVLCVMW